MKPKKSPKHDLERFSGIFFAIGLTIATSTTLWAINIEFKKIRTESFEFTEFDCVLYEPVCQFTSELPPPPILTETICGLPSAVDSLITKEDWEGEKQAINQDIPYSIIQDKPKFKACKTILAENEAKQCFKQELDRHVKAHFSYPEDCQSLCIQGRVLVQFRITKMGEVQVIATRGPHPSLEKKAAEIIEKLPRLIPGTQQGHPVDVVYAYPITFRLQN